MLIELAACAVTVLSIVAACRYFWITRRQPVRKDAPTGDSYWITPTSRWRG